MKMLEKLTLEEVAMASAQLLKVTHNIHNAVTSSQTAWKASMRR